MIDSYHPQCLHTMRTRCFTVLIFFIVASLGLAGGLAAQKTENLLESDAFFQQQRPEMDAWLKEHFPKGEVRTDTIWTEDDWVTLRLMPSDHEHASCSALQAAWQAHEQNDLTAFNQRVLLKWAFLAEVKPSQTIVEVMCHDPAHFYRRISMPQQKAEVDARSLRSIAPVFAQVGVVPMSFQGGEAMPKTADASETSAVISGKKAEVVCKTVKDFCTTKYASLPKARYIWDADLHYTEISGTEFQLEVTYITNVIASDRFFEYHKIYVTTQQ